MFPPVLGTNPSDFGGTEILIEWWVEYPWSMMRIHDNHEESGGIWMKLSKPMGGTTLYTYSYGEKWIFNGWIAPLGYSSFAHNRVSDLPTTINRWVSQNMGGHSNTWLFSNEGNKALHLKHGVEGSSELWDTSFIGYGEKMFIPMKSYEFPLNPIRSHHNIVEFWDEKVWPEFLGDSSWNPMEIPTSHGKSPSNPMGYPRQISFHEIPKSYWIPATIYPSIAFPATQGMVVALRMSELPISRNQA